MTLDTTELRRLHGAATAGEWGAATDCAHALHNAAPALLDAADRLARIEAVLVGEEAVRHISRALRCGFETDTEAARTIIGNRDDVIATAALAALRELIAAPAK